MKILVCIKPDTDGQDLGHFEALALEAGLVLKETCMDHCRVDVITAGPREYEAVVRRAFGMGADNGIHILTQTPDQDQGLVPASMTASLLARAIGESAYDLILTGVMSQDLMAGQTGPMVAQLLGLPCATAVVKIGIQGSLLAAEQELDRGYRAQLEITLPALVTIQAGFYTPRYPTLSNMLKAGNKSIVTHEEQEFVPGLPREIFLGTREPEKTRDARMVVGTLEEQLDIFHGFLREKHLL